MKKKNQLVSFIIFCIVISLSACNDTGNIFTVTVRNDIDIERNNELVQVRFSQLPGISQDDFTSLLVKNSQTGEILVSQLIDSDSDSKLDIIVFQANLKAQEEKDYNLILQGEDYLKPVIEKTTFSRFVPERTDDYAWENDLVAFRTYGPTAQKMIEEGIEGGTLSSGIDCWLKKVDYPIINKWYKKYVDGTGSYHEDTGEGLDNFHVGRSRGCGGIGVWNQDKKTLYTSDNFTKWETLTKGPLITRFKLDYDPWMAGEYRIKEYKIISLELGSNMSRFEVVVGEDDIPDHLTAGITLHKKNGNIVADMESPYFSYWQPHAGSELGMGIVVEKKYLPKYTEHIVEEADMSHILVHLKPVDGKVVYYAGFGWKESGQFDSEKDWLSYLDNFSRRLTSPLIVEVSGE